MDNNNKLQKSNPQQNELAVILQGCRVILHPQDVILRLSKCNTIALACNSNEITLAGIRKQKQSKEFVVGYISIWIAEFQEFVNVKNKMNKAQITITANDIYDSYYYFKLSDINLIFKNARKGEYGSLYESLDGIKILSWFNQYSKERLQYYDERLHPSRVDETNRVSASTSVADHTKEIDFFKFKNKIK